MIVTKPADFRMNQKGFFEKAYGGEPVVIARPRNENVMVISEKDYKNLLQQKRIIQYYIKIKNNSNHSIDDQDLFRKLEEAVKRSEEGRKQDISKRIGIAKGMIDDPEDFDDWDEDVFSLFTEAVQ